MLNSRLICHLPIIVPLKRCAVGNETREWEEGKLLIFDDSMEQDEKKNPTGELRIILLFDIWRPELTAERQGISAIFDAIDSFQPLPEASGFRATQRGPERPDAQARLRPTSKR